MSEEGEYLLGTQPEDDRPSLYFGSPPPSPKISAVLDPEGAQRKRRKPSRKHPASKTPALPRCFKCGHPIDLNEMFRVHEEVKQAPAPKSSRPANPKTIKNFRLWRECVFEVTGAKAPVNSSLKQEIYGKVKSLYDARKEKESSITESPDKSTEAAEAAPVSASS